MDPKKNKTIRRRTRLDRRVDVPGDNWPVLDLALLTAARKESLLVAQLRSRKPRWRLLPGGRA
jgi:hypothetical protein